MRFTIHGPRYGTGELVTVRGDANSLKQAIDKVSRHGITVDSASLYDQAGLPDHTAGGVRAAATGAVSAIANVDSVLGSSEPVTEFDVVTDVNPQGRHSSLKNLFPDERAAAFSAAADLIAQAADGTEGRSAWLRHPTERATAMVRLLAAHGATTTRPSTKAIVTRILTERDGPRLR